MIFSRQLGKLDGRSNEQSIQSIANHLRKMQEELEYRLSVLDSSNINEINADQTKIFLNGEDINNIITDQDGKMSQLLQTVEGFKTAVEEYEKGYSEWSQTVDGFKQQVGDYTNKVSEWSQTVDGFIQQVADYTSGYSQWSQTVEGFTQQVKNYETGYSNWQQTVDGFRADVQSYTQGYSSWEQTVAGFEAAVRSYERGLSTTLRLDASGFYITDQNGSVVTISGGQLDAYSVVAAKLLGETVYLLKELDGQQYIIGELDIGSTSTGYGIMLKTHTGHGGIAIESAGNVSITPGGSSYYVGIGAGGKFVSIQTDMQPSADSYYDLGTAYYKWADIYATNSEITTSDREKKNSIDYNLERYERFFDLLRPCSYKLNDGTSGRTHVNMISQDVEEALEESGLTSKDFAGFIKSPKTDKDGNVIEGEYEYALRYGEFIGLCIAEIQKLKARVDDLERKEKNDG